MNRQNASKEATRGRVGSWLPWRGYLFHSAGAPHAGFLDEEHLVLVHYDGDPDIVQEFEVVD